MYACCDRSVCIKRTKLTTADARLARRVSHSQATASTGIAPTDEGVVKKHQPHGEAGSSTVEVTNAIRADLSEAQRSRSELQNRLDVVTSDREKLQKRSGLDQRRISALDAERMQLRMRLRDREEELRGKAKLLDVCSPATCWCTCIR